MISSKTLLNFDAKLFFSDKDSLCYETKSENINEELFKWKDLFDFSNYPKDSKFFNETNKIVVGKMKYEFGGVIIDEFVGLKSKMCSIKKIDGKECNTAKGVSIAIECNKFKGVLSGKKTIRHNMKRIQSKKQKLGTHEIDKISLSCFDNKRYVLDDGLIFIKIVSQVVVRFKKIVIKKIVMIEKDCDD